MAKSRKKNPASGNPLLDLVITGGAFVALYLWLQNNCASASPINTSLCSTLFGTSTAASGSSTVETNCLSAFSSAVLAAAGGNQTLANSAMNALTASELTAIQTSCAAGMVPAIPSTVQAVITAGLSASGSGSSSGSSSSSSSGGTSLAIPSNLTVTPTINSALQGTVNVNGDPVSLAVITGNLGHSSGVVFNSAGADVTNLFTAAQIQQLVNAFLLAPTTSSGVSGLGYRGIPARYLHTAY
jgi:hypothetical protein